MIHCQSTKVPPMLSTRVRHAPLLVTLAAALALPVAAQAVNLPTFPVTDPGPNAAA